MPGGAAVEAREAKMVHRRPDSFPCTEMGLAFRTDRPVPIIRVVLVDESREALVSDQRPAAGDCLITSSACRWTVGPDGRPVEANYQTSPKAAVPWGGSLCFPLMAPRMTPEFDVTAILVASQQVCAPQSPKLRSRCPKLRST